ncbi:MAG: hypothetical protein K6A23_00720 [Butyrivibrio sp.]|nr:hypothetical protein [Butyrivibrio sp.]
MSKEYKNVISIPVHEKPEVIIDLLCNIKKYTKNTAVVLHVSKGFNWNSLYLNKEKFIRSIEEMEDVYINPEHLDTKWAGIIQTHISNFKYMDSNIDFENFVLMASNQLLISYDMDKWIGNNIIGVRNWQKLDVWDWVFKSKALNDKCFQNILKEINTENIFLCVPEGSFYNRKIFEKIVEIVDTYYVFDIEEETYPREEVYIPTIALSMVEEEKVRKGIFTEWIDGSLISGKLSKIIESGQISVKPVTRDLYTDNRIYLRQVYNGGYFDMVKKYFPDIIWIEQSN